MAEDAIEPLVTECPSCHTRFRVTEAQLSLAGGRVRCGACLMVFTGTDYLVFDTADYLDANREEADAALDAMLSELTAKDAPGESPTQAAEDAALPDDDDDAAAMGGAESETVETEAGEPHETEGDQEVGEAFEEIVLADAGGVGGFGVVDAQSDSKAGAGQDEAPVELDEVVPLPAAEELSDFELPRLRVDPDELVTGDETPTRRVRWWVPVAIVGGIVALSAQVLWYQYETWIQDPDMRAIYERVCPVVGCDLPVLKDVKRFYSKELVVRSHPNAADALIVDALIVNDAPFEQPFPVIELRFSALGGQLVAARRFRPAEYLSGELEGASVIPPRTPVHITLEIQDPGNEAVNYVMVFR